MVVVRFGAGAGRGLALYPAMAIYARGKPVQIAPSSHAPTARGRRRVRRD